MLPLRLNNTKYLSVINSLADNTDDVCYRSDRFSNVEEKVHQLVIEAREYPLGSAERQKSLTEIMRLISDKLWQENTPYYQDALQQTWVYFCENICETNTAQAYDSSRISLIAWVNTYLKQRLQDLYIENKKYQARKEIVGIQTSQPSEVNENVNLDNLEAKSNPSLLLKEVITWVETDPENELRRIHIEGHPKITCQELLRRRLPPVTSWQEIASEFHLSVSTLSSFYQQQCLPRLRQFSGVKI